MSVDILTRSQLSSQLDLWSVLVVVILLCQFKQTMPSRNLILFLWLQYSVIIYVRRTNFISSKLLTFRSGSSSGGSSGGGGCGGTVLRSTEREEYKHILPCHCQLQLSNFFHICHLLRVNFLVAKATQAFTAICNSISLAVTHFVSHIISQSQPIMSMVGFNFISQSK